MPINGNLILAWAEKPIPDKGFILVRNPYDHYLIFIGHGEV